MTTTATTESSMRCSTADREATAARLHTAAGEGRLTMDEVEERLTVVYAARHQHQLDEMTADLPEPRVRPAGWRAVLALLWVQLLADLAVLLRKAPATAARRRLLTAAAAVAAVLLVGGIVTLFVTGLGDDAEHHGFGVFGFEAEH